METNMELSSNDDSEITKIAKYFKEILFEFIYKIIGQDSIHPALTVLILIIETIQYVYLFFSYDVIF